jgi:hypothetical protein
MTRYEPSQPPRACWNPRTDHLCTKSYRHRLRMQQPRVISPRTKPQDYKSRGKVHKRRSKASPRGRISRNCAASTDGTRCWHLTPDLNEHLFSAHVVASELESSARTGWQVGGHGVTGWWEKAAVCLNYETANCALVVYDVTDAASTPKRYCYRTTILTSPRNPLWWPNIGSRHSKLKHSTLSLR